MTFLSRLFGKALPGSRPDDRAPVRALWQWVVAEARQPDWYSRCGMADTVPGRLDALTLTLAAVMLRMEQDEALIAQSALLAELFVEDMDGQLRQRGVGDLVVGKHIGKLMGALGGRIAALREALTAPDEGALDEVARRNATLIEGGDPALIAARLRDVARRLAATSDEDLLAGKIVP